MLPKADESCLKLSNTIESGLKLSNQVYYVFCPINPVIQFRLRSLLHDSVVLPEKRLETDPTSVLRIMYQFVTCTIGVEPGYAYDP